MNDRLDRPDRNDRRDRNAPRDAKVEQVLADQGLAPRPATSTLRGPMHAKGGWQILCISSDIQFASRVAHTAELVDAHPAIAWTLEDVERLPFWMFHAVVLDEAAQRDVTGRASARVRAHLAELPMITTNRDGADQALRGLIGSLTTAASGLHP